MTFSFYAAWGYADSPFRPDPLEGNELGSTLLVGRSAELRALEAAFRNPPRIPTVEGPTGVGKTSLLNVCIYRMLRALRQGKPGPLLIPCVRTFQPSDLQSLDQFSADLLAAVAQTLIQQRSLFAEADRYVPRLDSLAKWLNSPVIDAWNGGLSVFTAGATLGKQVTVNDASGFLRSGLRVQIVDELKRVFEDGEGVVCVLDNMELLDFSAQSKATLEALRDDLFKIRGLRLAFAGSRGVVHRILASPRLDGHFHDPILVGGVDDERAGEILRSRRLGYSKDRAVLPFLPLREDDFALLYRIQRANLRSALSLADSYCSHINRNPLSKVTVDAKAEAFSEWLHEKCRQMAASVSNSQTPRSWEVFRIAAARGGAFSPSDYEEFGCNDPANLRAFVKKLEEGGLVMCTVDEDDARRRHVDFTAKGWLVYYAQCVLDGDVES